MKFIPFNIFALRPGISFILLQVLLEGHDPLFLRSTLRMSVRKSSVCIEFVCVISMRTVCVRGVHREFSSGHFANWPVPQQVFRNPCNE